MGNLTRRPDYILINSLEDADVSVNGTELLINNYGRIDTEKIYSGFKCCYCPGSLRQVLVKVKPKTPCNECEKPEVGFSVFKTHELTGKPQIPSNFYGTGKYYGHIIDQAIESSTGYLDPQDIEECVANIVNAIGNMYPNAQALVNAYQRVRYTYTAGTITLVLSAVGSNYTVTYTGASIAALRANIFADPTKKIHVIDFSATHITIEGIAGFGFTCVVTNLNRSADHYWVRVAQINIEKEFFIRDLDSCNGTETELVPFVKVKVDPKDVARAFPIMHMSHVGMQPDLPIKNAAYCIYKFVVSHTPVYDLVGANHVEGYLQEVYFYVLQSVAEGALWDTKLDAAGVFDAIGFVDSCSCTSESLDESQDYISESDVVYEDED